MNILIKGDSKCGKAVFANMDIPKDALLIEFRGDNFDFDELPDIAAPGDDRFVQVCSKKYLGPSGNLDDFINHSCDPNAGLWFSEKIMLLQRSKILKRVRRLLGIIRLRWMRIFGKWTASVKVKNAGRKSGILSIFRQKHKIII